MEELGTGIPGVEFELPVVSELPGVGICDPDEELVRERVDKDFWALLPDFGIRLPPFEVLVSVCEPDCR
jgi:hypothetical protein